MIDSVETNSCYKLYVYNIYKAIPLGFNSGDAQFYFCQTIPIEEKRVTPLPEKFVKGISMESLNIVVPSSTTGNCPQSIIKT